MRLWGRRIAQRLVVRINTQEGEDVGKQTSDCMAASN